MRITRNKSQQRRLWSVLTATCFLLLFTTVGRFSGVLFGFDHTTARGTVAAEKTVDNSRSTADTGVNADRTRGTVLCAGPAFHARVPIVNPGVAVMETKDVMGADQSAHAATGTFFRVELQSDHIFQVNESSHQGNPSGHEARCQIKAKADERGGNLHRQRPAHFFPDTGERRVG
jgi:hypothetical protein